MGIISLYNREFVILPIHHQAESYGQNQNTNINRYTAFYIGRWFPQRLLPLFSYALRAVLLKSKGLSSQEIGQQTEMSHISVNSWVKRFKESGITGLHTRPGRGRKPIIDCSDEAAVRKAIEGDRQSVSKAREEWQNATGKEASDWTFKRFLSALAQDISE